ncbi:MULTISPECIES: glycoside hydrolase family 3 protein [unclassified Streptomyces]|uniref:glycoside hydrolase family 3 protein n=1 Tax=unclassified Streptomyces TaxID=2593676 RepID=UPI00225C3258|nr:MULTISPECIES: glycoside hydrolase family 3 protein [unclassified Streptomyces]MCX4988543.1 glycoside hydrolase family 3 protein [Streptomyces sp. NBC_00568]MCX5006236.1 glycoside hydrolase family 3 protein [Streptomyces sp. NBC_00638]
MTTFASGTTASNSKDGLTRDALTVLQPGFTGTTAPDWLLRRLGEGLASVGLFGRNIASPDQLAALTAQLRVERDDVLVAIDEEGGDVTRLEVRTGSSFPGNHALGAVDDVSLTEDVARELGRRLAACGVNLNWAPSADVNSNPSNPVIGVRSFGADTDLVARHTAAYVTGLQAAGVAACTKHFPGHGDTAVDSHHALPRIDADLSVLQSRELVPFRAAIAAGSRAVMSAHILVPALDPDRPATLSRRILTGLLREELGYDGLIVTDGMEMQAISATYGIERGSVLAIAAGADAICVGGGLADDDTVRRLRDALVSAVRAGELPEERLADAANRVRALAEWTAAASAASGTATAASASAAGTADGTIAAAPRAVVTGGSATAPGAHDMNGLNGSNASNATGGSNGTVGSNASNGSGGSLRTAGSNGTGGAVDVGLVAARRALTVTRSASYTPLTGAPFVAALTPVANIAVGDETPWGVAAELARLLPGTETGSFTGEDAGSSALAAAGERPLVAVVRDEHRHPWMAAALDTLLASRPDTVVVEMGVPQSAPRGALHIATHGAARVCGQAAAEVIAGE